MTITPNPVDITKGQFGSISVTDIVGTLEVSTANIGMHVESVNQTGTSATVLVQVYSNAIGSTGNVSFHDDEGDTTLVVNMVTDTWNSQLSGTDVFSRQQELANLLQNLRTQLNSITTLISVGLAAQIAGVVASIATLATQIDNLDSILASLGTGNVSVIG